MYQNTALKTIESHPVLSLNIRNAKICPCPDCPTYKKSNLSGTLFCARGKAKEEVKSESCPCPSCPIFIKYNLKNKYYCIKGKAP